MRSTPLFRSKKFWSAATAAVLFFICLLPIQAETADWPFSPVFGSPIVVNGRILTGDKTGDISNWVEIAQNGKYSLIVRQNFLNQQEFNYGNPLWQSVNYGYDYVTTDYLVSRARHNINHWFNVGFPIPNRLAIPGAYDVLPYTARLRDYTMQSSATLLALGTSYTVNSLYDGISKPTFYQTGIGDDVAFALSYGEAGQFVSVMRALRNADAALWYPHPFAVSNFNKLSIPAGVDKGMWLRSPGDVKGTAGAMSSIGTVFQFYVDPKIAGGTGYLYPALWVDSEIFGNAPKKPMIIPPAPCVVDGRILTPRQTGDISDWVEIAQSDGYSLIVRKNFINQQEFNYGNPLWQSVNYAYDFKTTDYQLSRVRHIINHWFNIGIPLPNNLGIPGAYDVLPWHARLRRFTMMNTSAFVYGTSYSKTSLTDGLSRPSVYQVGIGDDIAFALSYGEAAEFCSVMRALRNAEAALWYPHPFAVKNFNKLSIPTGVDKGMWLRSPGDVTGTAGAMSSIGTVFQFYVDPKIAGGTGYLYPALWVGKGIFEEDKATINVFHRDAISGDLLEPQTIDIIDPGLYGPYNAKTFPNYGPGQLAVYSDPPQGIVNAGETKNITYLYEKDEPPPPPPPTVLVIYHPNGGTGDIVIVPVPVNTDYEIEPQNFISPDPTRYEFETWNTAANNLGVTYRNGDIIVVTGNIVLFAHWAPIN